MLTPQPTDTSLGLHGSQLADRVGRRAIDGSGNSVYITPEYDHAVTYIGMCD